jgi:importin subunit beta-1
LAVGAVGDISRALEEKMQPYCDDIMQVLLSNLQNPQIERVIKPHIISTLGDIAMAVGKYYERYLPYVMGMLIQASQAKPDNLTTQEDVEWFTTLRESILEGYSGILQGLSGEGKGDAFAHYLDNVVPFLSELAQNEDRDELLTRAAAGLIGDLAARLGPQVRQLLQLPFVIKLVMSALAGEDRQTKESGEFAKKAIEKAMS